IDVQVYTRDGVEKDSRAQAVEIAEIEKIKKDLQDELRIRESDIHQRVHALLLDKVADAGQQKLSKGSKITADYLEKLAPEKWFEISLQDDQANKQLEAAAAKLEDLRKGFLARLDAQKLKVTSGDDLAPGV